MKLPKTIQAAFAARAAPLLDRIALDSGDRSLTFAELDERSTRIAGYLQRHGVRHGDRVGLFSQRSIDAVAALLGILKAGAAYVPFDPAYPVKLLRYMYDDCAPALMLVEPSLLASGTDPFWTGPGHDLRAVAQGAETPPLAAAALP
jgi:non-ribosomal peptide synthetase component F